MIEKLDEYTYHLVCDRCDMECEDSPFDSFEEAVQWKKDHKEAEVEEVKDAWYSVMVKENWQDMCRSCYEKWITRKYHVGENKKND